MMWHDLKETTGLIVKLQVEVFKDQSYLHLFWDFVLYFDLAAIPAQIFSLAVLKQLLLFIFGHDALCFLQTTFIFEIWLFINLELIQVRLSS